MNISNRQDVNSFKFGVSALVGLIVTYFYMFIFIIQLKAFQGKFWPEISGWMSQNHISNQSTFFYFLIGACILSYIFGKKVLKKISVIREYLKPFGDFINHLWFWIPFWLSAFVLLKLMNSDSQNSSTFWSKISNGHMTFAKTGLPMPFADLLGPASCTDRYNVMKVGDPLNDCDPFGRTGINIYPRFASDYLRMFSIFFDIKFLIVLTVIIIFFTGFVLLRANNVYVLTYLLLLLTPAIALGIERANLSLTIVGFTWLGVLALSYAKRIDSFWIKASLFLVGTILVQAHAYIKLFPVVGIATLAILEIFLKSRYKFFTFQIILVVIVFAIFHDEFIGTFRINSGEIDTSYSFGDSLMARSFNTLVVGRDSGFISTSQVTLIFSIFTLLIFLNTFLSSRLNQHPNLKSSKTLGLKTETYFLDYEVYLFFTSILVFSSLTSVQYDYQLVLCLPILVTMLRMKEVSCIFGNVVRYVGIFYVVLLLFTRGFLIHNGILIIVLFSLIIGGIRLLFFSYNLAKSRNI